MDNTKKQSTKNHTKLPKHHIQKAHAARGGVESEPVRTIEPVEIKKTVEHKITDEQVKPHIETHPEIPNISEDLKKQGVRSDSPTQFPTYKTVKLPMSQKKIPSAMKQPPFESIRWLGTLSYYIMEQSKYRFTKTHESVFGFLKKIVSREFGKFPE